MTSTAGGLPLRQAAGASVDGVRRNYFLLQGLALAPGGMQPVGMEGGSARRGGSNLGSVLTGHVVLGKGLSEP